MANLNLFKIFETDLSQMDRDVYEHLQQKVELFSSLTKQIDDICRVAHSKYGIQDYLQVAYMTYELKQLNSKSFVVLEHVNPISLIFRTLDGNRVTAKSKYFSVFQTLEKLIETLMSQLTRICKDLYDFCPEDNAFAIDAIYSLLSHVFNHDMPEEVS
jgi:hypothetical protein